MAAPIKCAILEDHQSIIDGYEMRLQSASDIDMVGVANNGTELNDLLQERPDIDLLIMDIEVPASPHSTSTIPILYYVPKILANHPNLHILIISMHNSPLLVQALIKAGISGYIFKEDRSSIQRLPAIIKSISTGAKYFSSNEPANIPILTNRQTVILEYCASYPDLSTDQVALELGIASSTIRNALSETYTRLSVHSKAAAIAKAKDLGMIP